MPAFAELDADTAAEVLAQAARFTTGVLQPLIWLILPGYLLAVILTWFSTEEFVNVAWASAGVTTGPITVPLVLAMGLGFGNATHAVEGFGILSMASIGPIITVMISGLWSRYKANAEIRAAAKEGSCTPAAIAEGIV